MLHRLTDWCLPAGSFRWGNRRRGRHRVRFTMWDYQIEHPEPDDDPCPIDRQIAAMRLDDGRMQVQGLYRETDNGLGFVRIGDARFDV